MTDAQQAAIDGIAPADRRVCVYDLTPASDVESALHKKLIEMGWKPPRSADEELRRDAERMKFAAEAPNLHGQVYLSCRLRGAAHQQALDLAHDAEKMYGAERVSEADLHIILAEISDAIAAEKREG